MCLAMQGHDHINYNFAKEIFRYQSKNCEMRKEFSLLELFPFHPGHVMCLQEEFCTWLAYHKRKWKLQRVQRLERRQLLAMQQQGRSEGPLHDLVQERTASLSGYLQRQNRALAESPWQLVQVQCTCSRGYMNVRVNCSYSLRLNVCMCVS